MASPELDRAIAMFRADKAETQAFQVGIFRVGRNAELVSYSEEPEPFQSLIRWLYEI